MNKIVPFADAVAPMSMSVQGLVSKSRGKETAFIGQVGTGPHNSLYLITYDCVILAADPFLSWNGMCSAMITRFVNIEIKVM